MVNQLARNGQMVNADGTSMAPISALTNDEQFLYVAAGNVVYRYQKSKLGQTTVVPSMAQPNQTP